MRRRRRQRQELVDAGNRRWIEFLMLAQRNVLDQLERTEPNPRSTTTMAIFQRPTTDLELGDRVRDKITGYAGTITGICDYITGCRQMLVQPEVPFGGTISEMPKAAWIDEDRLERTGADRLELAVARAGFGDQAPTK